MGVAWGDLAIGAALGFGLRIVNERIAISMRERALRKSAFGDWVATVDRWWLSVQHADTREEAEQLSEEARTLLEGAERCAPRARSPRLEWWGRKATVREIAKLLRRAATAEGDGSAMLNEARQVVREARERLAGR